MADLKIYNNGENKILFSAGDRIIRQPYDFKFAFQNSGGLNCYISIPNLSLTQYYSVILWSNRAFTDSGVYRVSWSVKNTNKDNYGRLILDASSCFDGIYKNSNNTDPTGGVIRWTGSHDSIGVNVSMFIWRKNNIVTHYRNLRKDETTTSKTNDFPIEEVRLGAYRGSNGDVPNRYLKPDETINRFLFYSREVPLNEYTYFYNNGLGQEPQIYTDIEIDIRCDNKAEILNIGGVDVVGVRDYSGNNRHGKIMNLPAGTLQEQLDWANANLFVPFIY